MNNTRFFKNILLGGILVLCYHDSVLAEVTKNDILHNLFGDVTRFMRPSREPVDAGTIYNNDDGSQILVGYAWIWGNPQYYIAHVDPVENKYIYQGNWISPNITINGQEAFSGSTGAEYQPTYDFDENGQLKAVYSAPRYGGNLQFTCSYAVDGQMLVYDTQGELIGAYNNFYDKLIHDSGRYNQGLELNHISEDGSYIVKEGNNIIGLYQKDGGLMEYKYDAGGNLVAQYENGVEIYRRRIYTPSEAAAAVSGKNTFKLKYR